MANLERLEIRRGVVCLMSLISMNCYGSLTLPCSSKVNFLLLIVVAAEEYMLLGVFFHGLSPFDRIAFLHL